MIDYFITKTTPHLGYGIKKMWFGGYELVAYDPRNPRLQSTQAKFRTIHLAQYLMDCMRHTDEAISSRED